MTRERFIKKWLGNNSFKYCEEHKELMREDLDSVIEYAQQQVNSVDLADVVLSEERAELCQSFVVDTRTSSATKCANCQKEAWEHRHN